jgi:hypothetical protein
VGDGIAECRRTVDGEDRKVYRGRSMKVAEGGMPSKNTIMDAKGTEG